MGRRFRFGVARALGLVAAMTVATSVRAQWPAPVAAVYGGDAVMIHGIGGYWPGCGRFKDQLHAAGYRVWDYPVALPSRLAHNIAQKRASGEMRGELCLTGYCTGADQVITIARHLRRYGIIVDRLVLIEPDMPRPIPANVRYTFNLYASRPLTDWLPVFRGVRVVPDDPASAVVNYNVKRTDQVLARQSHFTMATNERAQRMVVSQATRQLAGPLAPAGTVVR
jgi:hypothetical protein